MSLITREGSLTTQDRVELRWWASLPDRPRALVLVVHGYLEHSGRYLHLVEALNAAGFATARFDSRGHGRSGGRRAFVRSWRDYLCDLQRVREEVCTLAPEAPLFLLGHSQGGLQVLTYAADPLGAGIAGVVALSPLVAFAGSIPAWKDLLGRLMSRIWPSLTLDAGIDPELLTHVREAVEWRNADPLVGTRATARWFTEALGAQARLQEATASWSSPLLLMAAEDDRLVDSGAARAFLEALPVTDRTWKLWDGMYHELLHETVRPEVEAAIVDWLAHRAA